MLLIRVSIPELSPLCFSAEKHLFKKENPFYLAKYFFQNSPLCSSTEGKFVHLGFYAL